MKHIKLFEEFQYESHLMDVVNEMATAKDLKRISDIISKSGGNEAKAVQLATQMANIIKDKNKAMQRYEAALEIVGKDHPVTQVFADLASSMGHDIEKATATATAPKITNGKLGTDSSLSSEGRERRQGERNPILPLGPTNLVTGSCKYFNIYDTWGKDNGTTIELWKDEDNKYKLIFTSGSGPIFKLGTQAVFDHDQTRRYLFMANLVDWANIGDADLLVKKYNIKSATGYVYK